jgi:protein MBA1
MKAQELITNAAVKYMSKPTVFKRAIYQPKRSVLIPTAKALHRSMATALASGDRDTINKVCSKGLADSLLTSIDTRPRGRRYAWELVAYTNKMFYPSVKSHKLSPMSRERGDPIVRQAVVAISSKQRRVQYDAHGQVIPGSEKEMDVVEHFVMSCLVDSRTWQQHEWRIVGTVKPTSLEGWMKEKALLKRVMETR